MRAWVAALAFASVSTWATIAAAQAKPETAKFALIIGTNTALDLSLEPLHYADDDAARYFDLFRTLGAHAVVLATLDTNTTRLHAQVAAEALPPTRANLEQAVAQLAREVKHARALGVATSLYVVYAGHGREDGGTASISLDDAWLDGNALHNDVLQRIGADVGHLIVDACYSYYLAYSRGAGSGERTPTRGITEGANDLPVGLILSTSSARESHEWAAVQSGVFSHEVRSGLYGAADSDGDGQITYQELGAFVQRANAAIPNERYRPQIYARPPRTSETLVDLGRALDNRLEIPSDKTDHFFLEDTRGVRLLDFHNRAGHAVQLLRPMNGDRLYLRRAHSDTEYIIPPRPGIVMLATLQAKAARVRERGAANDAFRLLFDEAFTPTDVSAFAFESSPADVPTAAVFVAPPSPWRSRLLIGTTVAAGAFAAASTYMWLDTRRIVDNAAEQSQVARQEANSDVRRGNALTIGFAGAALAAGGAALALWLWPHRDVQIGAGVSPGGGASVALSRGF